MIKVLHVLGSLNCGGAETLVVNWWHTIDRSNFQFDFLVYGNEKGFYEDMVESLGSHVIHIPKPSINYLSFYHNVVYAVQDGHYDVVHVHTLFNGGFVLKAAKQCGVPIRISHSHTTQNKEVKEFNPLLTVYEKVMRHWILKCATHFLACGLQAGKFLYGDKVFDQKGTILYNGIIPEQFKYDPAVRSQQRIALQIKSNDLVIGHIGRFTEVKNHAFLVRVFASLVEQEDNCKLLLIGDGPLRQTIENLSINLGVRDKVIFAGMCSDVAPYLQMMDVMLFPSLFEGIPMALIEAQANGLPCLVSDTVSHEIKVLKKTKFIRLDDGEVYWKDFLLHMMPFLREKRAVELVANSPFNLRKSIEKLQSIYQEVMGEVNR